MSTVLLSFLPRTSAKTHVLISQLLPANHEDFFIRIKQPCFTHYRRASCVADRSRETLTKSRSSKNEVQHSEGRRAAEQLQS